MFTKIKWLLDLFEDGAMDEKRLAQLLFQHEEAISWRMSHY
jgi:hypothetical protein